MVRVHKPVRDRYNFGSMSEVAVVFRYGDRRVSCKMSSIASIICMFLPRRHSTATEVRTYMRVALNV